MLHDIAPAAYNNDISFRAPVLEDKIIIYRGKQVLAFVEGGTMRAPLFADLFDESKLESMRAIYLFAVGEDVYFMAEVSDETIDAVLARQPYDASSEMDGWAFLPLQKLIEYHPKRERFALMVGHEYWNWYESSQYCGRCGAKTEHDRVERMMRCPACGLMIFPKVFPAVIVAITRPDGKVLATRYKGRPYANYALIAGYCEMGETVEQTVHREVMEEVGLRVKDLRYYKSQPWPDSSSLLFGFFCELEGDPEIRLDEHELSFAEWLDREELLTDNDHSLTREMMGVLREHRETDFCIVEATAQA